MLIGYMRTSTTKQDYDRQIEKLKEYGVDERLIYAEKKTGKTTEGREQLKKCILELNPGDMLVVTELARLGRNARDLYNIQAELSSKSVELVSIKENIDTTTPSGKAMFGMLAVMAEFERDMIALRTQEALEIKKANGIKLGRKATKKENIDKALKLYNSKQYTLNEIQEMTNVSKSVLYRELQKIKYTSTCDNISKRI